MFEKKNGSAWAGPKEDDTSPVIYHSGVVDRFATPAFEEAEQDRFCASYYKIASGVKADTYFPLVRGRRRFLDSGAFSFLTQRANANETDIEAYLDHYVAWIKDNKVPLDFYITFDYRVEAPLVYTVTKALFKRGIRPVPVYHGDASLDWLKKYADDGHKLICLSKRNFLSDRKNLRHYYDQAFHLGEKLGVRFHALASGFGPEVWDYPWYSVDSTSVMRSGAVGTIIHLTHGGTLKAFSISTKKGRGIGIDAGILHQAKNGESP